MKRILTTMVALSLLAISSGPVRAAVVSNNGITHAGNWTWSYKVDLSPDEKFSSLGAVPNVNSGKTGSLSSVYKDYFTIYDFSGFTGVHTEPSADWAFQALTVGSTPKDYSALTDSPATVNLTWYYVGASDLPFTPPTLTQGGFSAQSIYGVIVPGIYTADDTDVRPLYFGKVAQNNGSVDVPNVPEPSTFVLFGAGLIGAMVMKRRAKK